jgi:CrcB protein
MTHFFLVALGGAVGSTCRYYLSSLIAQRVTGGAFPLSTWLVNVLGCLVAGIVLGLSERFQFLSAEARILIFSGILGGFTTFSAFALETVSLLKQGDLFSALLYVFLSVAIGVSALWLGCALSSSAT